MGAHPRSLGPPSGRRPVTLDEAFSKVPTFTTSRLVLRPLELVDAEAIFEIKGDPGSPSGTRPSLMPTSTRRAGGLRTGLPAISGAIRSSGSAPSGGRRGPSGAAATGTSTRGPGAPSWDTSSTGPTGTGGSLQRPWSRCSGTDSTAWGSIGSRRAPSPRTRLPAGSCRAWGSSSKRRCGRGSSSEGGS